MLDIEALEAAGFTKTMTSQEWEEWTRRRRSDADYMANLRADYVLKRGPITITTEQNSQRQAPYGIETTVHHPEIAIITADHVMQRVTCAVDNTELILELAHQLEGLERKRFPTDRPNAGHNRRRSEM